MVSWVGNRTDLVICTEPLCKTAAVSRGLLSKASCKDLQELIIVPSTNGLLSFWGSEIIPGVFLLIAVAVSSVSIKAFLIANIHCGISKWNLLPLCVK